MTKYLVQKLTLILVSSLFVTAIAYAADSKPIAKKSEVGCSIFEAVYKPSVPRSKDAAYDYRMNLEKIMTARAGEPFAYFIINTLDNQKRTKLSTLKMSYNCGGSGAFCIAVYHDEYYSGKNPKFVEQSFPAVFLNKDFSEAADTFISNKAPYAIILPEALQRFHYTQWEDKKTEIRFYTDGKIGPQGIDSWIFDSCNK